MAGDLDLLLDELGLDLPVDRMEQLRLQVAHAVQRLLQDDFSRLVALLYRVDVSEPKLRSMLIQQEGTDASIIIADLLIERQLQKKAARERYRRRDDEIPDSDKW